MTSNLGSTAILEVPERDRQKDLVMGYVRETFRPEFVNRIDEYIIFEALRMDQIKKIVRLQVCPNTNTAKEDLTSDDLGLSRCQPYGGEENAFGTGGERCRLFGLKGL